MDNSRNAEEERGITKYNIKDAIHKLSCSHAFNEKSRYDYYMRCIILKKMPDNRLKILVFGDRYWKYHDDKKQIRYVDSHRVKPLYPLSTLFCGGSKR